MIFDNYDAPAEVGRIVPYFPNGDGAIIITSRHRDVRALGKVIDVGGMEEEESIDLLLSRRAHERTNTATSREAQQIVKLLGYLPLAIDQAGAYIGERNLDLSSFKKHYSDRRDRIFDQTPTSWDYNRIITEEASIREIPQSVMTTWELSFGQLHEAKLNQQHLLKFLSIAAFIAEGSVTGDVFREYTNRVPASDSADDWLAVFCSEGSWDTYAYQDHLARLASLSLIQDFNIEGDLSFFSLHPMVKQWLQLRIPRSERRDYIREASNILTSSFSLQQGISRRNAEELLSH